MPKLYSIFLAVLFFTAVHSPLLYSQNGVIIGSGADQQKLISAYRFVLEESDGDYRNHEVTDGFLFPEFGESSIYRIMQGPDAGSFVYANALPDEYAGLIHTVYTGYAWETQDQISVQFKRHPRRVAIMASGYRSGNASLTWEWVYFERLFSEFLMNNIAYTIDEETLSTNGLDENTRLFIIPAFLVNNDDYTYYIDSIIAITPGIKEKIDEFLNRGGHIYAEGNACYFIEKLGYLESGAVTYSIEGYEQGNIDIVVDDPADLLSLGSLATNDVLYGPNFPIINSSRINSIVSSSTGNSCIFRIQPAHTLGGSIHCNTGLPTVSGLSDPYADNNQIGWTLNSIFSAFSSEVDITRKVRNQILYGEQIGDNAISYDRLDTFEVDLQIRNLSGTSISLNITETIKPYFTFLDVTSGETHGYDNQVLTFTGLNLSPHSEHIITYRVVTPEPDNTIHEDVDQYLDEGTLIAVSENTTQFALNGYNKLFKKNKNYADILFSARIFADTDVNYKNFLGLFYQPFKVFMIMENKSRSAALNTQYVQYIPKDVPFYWSDQSLNIPILKTPGGKYVDVLRGSNDEDNPEYDMDSDGDPDVWLDTASIYPKGYTLAEEEVYWANPWNHLRTGVDSFVFEDIDHDGIIPEDTDGDGIVDANFDEDDKIRVWKVTWDIGRVTGYEYYDPYCSYEIWVDPPDLVPMSAGIAHAYDSLLVEDYPGMFYPYNAGIEDTTWTYWMERGEDGNVKWDQLVHQRINNYEGFTFIDTSEYTLLPTDSLIGTAPQPHREFIAVLSLGGEEIDMRNYTPTNSLYSKVNYETVFGEERVTPIRTTYSYYAPLPNPLQFEYLSNNFRIIDSLGNFTNQLPEYGNAHLVFDMDASTEYTYYWIRNMGYDVDYNDPSESLDGIEAYGDGVFGYFVYSLPKGMGGYRMSLAMNEDGTYNTDSIVQIDGQPFSKWIDNPNTWNEVEIWETPFEYQVYIPQILIPPALDDDNFDSTDDWIDDRGDRFCSETGFLHDAFMPGNGEDYSDYPEEPFIDDIYGQVDSGWYAGTDNTYGDDYFETLGKTHITIHADYLGRGREGSVEISKGGVLVCEEIFGGSPWVIFSHVLSGFAQGTDISIESEIEPELIYYGIDTVYLKHIISDTNEPHDFNTDFDPFHVSYGFDESTITTFVGAKDPCSLVEPAVSMPAILDPDYDYHTFTLVPFAAENPGNPDLVGYPRDVSGTFVEVRVEVGNSTDDNWINTCVKSQLSPSIGSIEMSYVAYPRPLVPSHVSDGEIVPGDQSGTFTTGWRFNQPEGEVLIKMGDTLNLLQPTRRAYFVFLVKINPALENGIYKIPFILSGERKYYDGTSHESLSYEVPDALFSIVEKNENGYIIDFEELVLDNAGLTELLVNKTSHFTSLGEIKFSPIYFDISDFETIENTLPYSGNTIDVSCFHNFPTPDTAQLFIVEKGIVDSYNSDAEILPITHGQTLYYNTSSAGNQSVKSAGLAVKPIGPRIRVTNEVYSINSIPVEDTIMYEPDEDLYIQTRMTVKNTGTDISSNTLIHINPGTYYTILTDSLDENCTVSDGILIADMGDIIPGEHKIQYLPFLLNVGDIPEGADIRTIIDLTNIYYEGTLVSVEFSFEDPEDVLLDVYDFEAISISFINLDEETVEVTASAHNRGIYGNNVWFRIYPVIGDGVHEFPFAEHQQEEFLPGETIELSGIYNLPETDKAIAFIAIIDDGQKFTEITELNNSIRIDYQTTGIENTTNPNNSLCIYPIPFTDCVNFSYKLDQPYHNVIIQIYNLQGQLVHTISDCPGTAGNNFISWRNSNLSEGSYQFSICGMNNSGQKRVIFNGQLLKGTK